MVSFRAEHNKSLPHIDETALVVPTRYTLPENHLAEKMAQALNFAHATSYAPNNRPQPHSDGEAILSYAAQGITEKLPERVFRAVS
jgi:hypothetical protein